MKIADFSKIAPAGIAVIFASLTVPRWHFVGNENQYLLFATRANELASRGDWLSQTKDTSSWFTFFLKPIYELLGLNGLVIVQVVALAYLFWCTFFLCETVRESSDRRINWVVSSITCLSVGVSGLFSRPIYSAYSGFGGQYLVSSAVQIQPSLAGIFLVYPFAILIRELNRNVQVSLFKRCVAVAHIAITCFFAPTYMFATVFLFGLPILVRALQIRSFTPIFKIGSFFAAGPLIGFLANLSTIQGTLNVNKTSLKRFAFERIPQHTLISNWERADVILLLVSLGAGMMAARNPKQRLIAISLFAWLTVVFISSFIVLISRNVQLALLFPWRFSSIALLLSVIILIGEFTDIIFTRFRVRTTKILWLCTVSMLVLLPITFQFTKNPLANDEALNLVTRAKPTGIGLVPLESDNIRLNGNVPIYIDLKSPPYNSKDLEQWWLRVDEVKSAYQSDASLCAFVEMKKLDWLIAPSSMRVSCDIPTIKTLTLNGDTFVQFGTN